MNALPCAVDCCDNKLRASGSELAIGESEVVEGSRERDMIIFCLSFKGRKRGGMLCHVFRPIITEFVDWQ